MYNLVKPMKDDFKAPYFVQDQHTRKVDYVCRVYEENSYKI